MAGRALQFSKVGRRVKAAGTEEQIVPELNAFQAKPGRKLQNSSRGLRGCSLAEHRSGPRPMRLHVCGMPDMTSILWRVSGAHGLPEDSRG